jgi:transcriptional regulator with XRE-family HTH domain
MMNVQGKIDASPSIFPMLITITSPEDLGLLIRTSRKSQKLRMDDVAGTAGVGPVFVREVERGKQTVQLGRVMQLLAELGITLKAEVPDQLAPAYDDLKRTGVKPLKPRRSSASRRTENTA